MSRRWLVIADETQIVLCRPGAQRFDVAVCATFPVVRPVVLAHEIRKDLWRLLQSLRGFSPVVKVAPVADHLEVTAGGTLRSRSWPRQKTLTEIEGLLSDPAKRARWIAHARQT